jgi:guanylate kinase
MTDLTQGSHPIQQGLLFVLSGPSGAGKDAVMARLREQHFPLRFGVTATTRRRREGETHGLDYYFVSNDEFDRMIAADDLLEWAVVHGNRYGVPRVHTRELIESGHDVLVRVDVQGAASIRSRVAGAVLIFLTVPAVDALQPRLLKRNTETPAEMAIRLTNALEEMRRLSEFDYVVVNDDGGLDEAVEKVKAIIAAEKCRVHIRETQL